MLQLLAQGCRIYIAGEQVQSKFIKRALSRMHSVGLIYLYPAWNGWDLVTDKNIDDGSNFILDDIEYMDLCDDSNDKRDGYLELDSDIVIVFLLKDLLRQEKALDLVIFNCSLEYREIFALLASTFECSTQRRKGPKVIFLKLPVSVSRTRKDALRGAKNQVFQKPEHSAYAKSYHYIEMAGDSVAFALERFGLHIVKVEVTSPDHLLSFILQSSRWTMR